MLSGDHNPANDSAGNSFTVASMLEPGWHPRTPVPVGAGKGVKDGGWLAYSTGSGLIYAVKGNKLSEYYAYDAAYDTWTKKPDWPLGIEAKAPKKGASAIPTGDDLIYALKGNNTLGFWSYDVGRDSWKQLKDIPLGATNKKVKAGTDLAYDSDSGFVYCLA